MIYCQTHSKRLADFHCPECELGLCKDCVKTESVNYKTTLICPFCRKPVTSLAPYKPLPPIWSRLPEILVFPFTGHGKMILLAWTIFSIAVFILLFFLPHIFIAVYALYFGSLVSYFYIIVRKGEDGDFTVPDWAEFEDLWSLFWAPVGFLVGALSAFWPTLIYLDLIALVRLDTDRSFMEVLMSPFYFSVFMVILLWGASVMPMALLVMGVFKKLRYALNPLFLLRQIGKISGEYLAFLITFCSFLLVLGLASYALYRMFSGQGPLTMLALTFLLFSATQLYFFMVLGHLLGYLAFQTRYKLQWWPDTKKIPVFWINGRQADLF